MQTWLQYITKKKLEKKNAKSHKTAIRPTLDVRRKQAAEQNKKKIVGTVSSKPPATAIQSIFVSLRSRFRI